MLLADHSLHITGPGWARVGHIGALAHEDCGIQARFLNVEEVEINQT